MQSSHSPFNIASNRSKWVARAGLFVGLLTVWNCGGGGGGAPAPNDPIAGLSNIRIEPVLLGSNKPIDPQQIFVGDQVRFRLVGRNASNETVYVNVEGFTSTATSSGTVGTDGAFTAVAASSPFTVQVTVGSSAFTTSAQVKAPDVVLTGLLRTQLGFPAARITVQCLNSSGAVVASGNTSSDGSIRITTPATATRLSVAFTTADPGATIYARQFFYNGSDYSTLISGCTSPLGPLTSGSTYALLTNVIVYQLVGGTPPPPPDGCGP